MERCRLGHDTVPWSSGGPLHRPVGPGSGKGNRWCSRSRVHGIAGQWRSIDGSYGDGLAAMALERVAFDGVDLLGNEAAAACHSLA